MTLHEAIETVLRSNKRPLTAKAIANSINTEGFYHRNDYKPVEAKQVLARVKNYPSLFEQVNGLIILVEDQTWRDLLINYWYLNNTLRGLFNTSDVQFIVAVLLFYKRCSDLSEKVGSNVRFRGLATYNDISVNRNYSLIEALKDFENFRFGPEGIFEQCAGLLLQLDDSKRREIFYATLKLNTTELDDYSFGGAFEYILTLDAKESHKSGVTLTPYSLRELMLSVLAPEPGKTLYDPVAGTGGLLVQAYQYTHNLQIEGTEINRRIAQLGNMNLIMHGLQGVTIRAADCFEMADQNHQAFDYIIADLPAIGVTNSFGHSYLFRSYNLRPPSFGTSFGSLVLLILSSLNGNGKAVITVSESFLMKKGFEKEIRDLLLEHDVVESVISLPHGTLRPYTDSKMSLLVLNKNKRSSLRGRVRFIKARAAEQDIKSVYLNTEEILYAYKSELSFSKDSQILSISELQPDSSLSAETYDEQYHMANHMLREGNGKLLSDLVRIKPGVLAEKTDIHSEGEYQLVKIENLSNDILRPELTQDIATKIYLNSKYERALIRDQCLLIARIGDNLRPTIFIPDETRSSIIIHNGIYALYPNDRDGIDLEYLYYQFHSSFVLEQVAKRRLGAVMPYTSIMSLKQIVIPYVDRANQRNFIESQKANLIAEEKNRASAVLKALGSREEIRRSESDIVKTLTHQLRPTFTVIHSLAGRIKRVIDKEGLSELMEYNDGVQQEFIDPEIEEFIEQPENYSLGQLINKVIGDTEHLSSILSTVDKVMNFKLSGDDLHPTNLSDFLKQYKAQKDIAINGNYEIVIKGEATVTSMINEPAFKELLDQLLQNAEDHGFVEGIHEKRYRAQFTVRLIKNRNIAAIDYTNNGAPYELQQKDFVNAFEKGRLSKGSGIGGNYINRIVEAHRGEIKVVENNEKGFAMTIELPINKPVQYE